MKEKGRKRLKTEVEREGKETGGEKWRGMKRKGCKGKMKKKGHVCMKLWCSVPNFSPYVS